MNNSFLLCIEFVFNLNIFKHVFMLILSELNFISFRTFSHLLCLFGFPLNSLKISSSFFLTLSLLYLNNSAKLLLITWKFSRRLSVSAILAWVYKKNTNVCFGDKSLIFIVFLTTLSRRRNVIMNKQVYFIHRVFLIIDKNVEKNFNGLINSKSDVDNCYNIFYSTLLKKDAKFL